MLLSIIIPILNEKVNLIQLIPKLHELLQQLVLPVDYEIILVDGGSTDGTVDLVEQWQVKYIRQNTPGYGGALRDGFKEASGKWIITMDADLSHAPEFIRSLWQSRNQAEIVIASRYITGGKATMPWIRLILSRILNYFFSYGLSLRIKDMSSGFRLYRSESLKKITGHLISRDFDVLEEILIRAYAEGYRILEIPFHYYPRLQGKTHAKLVRFGIAFLRTFYRMWKLRNSIQSADYDARAYNSIIPLQRYWQRKRVAIITKFIANFELQISNIHPNRKLRILDIGCGSSYLVQKVPYLIGADIQFNKLRYLRYQLDTFGLLSLVNTTILSLPFKTNSIDIIVCSQVIEHLQNNTTWFNEINRVLVPNGVLILGTPDYHKLAWLIIEYFYKLFVPSGYADEHITHYTLLNLKELLNRNRYQILDTRYICRAELILAAKKLG
ncbi:MAG: glycosyltransferase [bacterium]|nr:glycosyltransferase [bacterium]